MRYLFALLWIVAANGYADTDNQTILVYGDSLSAAYGIDHEAGWVNLLQNRLKQGHYPYRVVNASISGETTSGGLARIDNALDKHEPAIVVIELGGNDGIRGLPMDKMRDNLAGIIEQSYQQEADVLLIGMRLPPNFGPSYTERFHKVYSDLADEYQASWVPFLLEGVGENLSLMQADGVHPRAEAQATILENVWEILQPMLQEQRATAD